VYAGVGRKLVDSLKNETVVEDDRALGAFEVRPRGIHDAIARALAFEDRAIAQTRWSDEAFAEKASFGGVRRGSRLVDIRSAAVVLSPSRAFAPIQAIGGATGWYKGAALWRLRGLLDVLVGGPGLRRGRRDPVRLEVGDTLDFWRVEAFEQDRLLRLHAEMRVPGRAWLQFEVSAGANGRGSTITQTAIFDPSGLFGLVYWYGLWPFHGYIFGGMLRNIVAAARDVHGRRAGAAAGCRFASVESHVAEERRDGVGRRAQRECKRRSGSGRGCVAERERRGDRRGL